MAFRLRLVTMIRYLLAILAMGFVLELATPPAAEARAGRGRSSGRSSGFQRAPHHQPQGHPSSAPRYNNNGNNNNGPAGQAPASNNRGGFFRSMAGGIAGGFLGSMLFGSVARAFGMGGMGGGGIGFFEILLLAGLGYLVFRWWKGRQQAAVSPSYGGATLRSMDAPVYEPTVGDSGLSQSAGYLPPMMAMDSDEASDVFFRIQGAWTRRDLSPVKALLSSEMATTFEHDMAELRRDQRINRLENISIRQVSMSQPWQGNDGIYTTARFLANLLDYTVDEQTGRVVAGSDSEPVKFEEDWTFRKQPGSETWQLAGISQV